MWCPFCQAKDTRVVDSRLNPDGSAVRRRRECAACQARFTTMEAAQLKLPAVVKSDEQRQPFSEEKLRTGLAKALEKRPVATDEVEAAVTYIMGQARASGETELPSRQIGEWVMDALKRIDQVAYVRFASVYRRFADVQDFREEVERLQSDLPTEMQARQLPLIGGRQDES